MNQPARHPSGSTKVSLKERIMPLWVPVFMMIGISILSGTKGPQLGPISFVGLDKVGHFVVFGLLGIAWLRALRHWLGLSRACLFLSVICTVGFGLMDELHQLRTPGRYFEWADLLADALGAFVFSTLYLCLPGLRNLLEVKIGHWPRLRRSEKSPNFR